MIITNAIVTGATKDFAYVSTIGHRLTLKCLHPMSIADKGHSLLALEKKLRMYDPHIEVFLEPTGDMNKLRLKLRGVKV